MPDDAHFRVQSAERINQVLRQMNLTDETSFVADEIREIARKSAVNTIVTGNFSKFGEKLRINISLVDAETGDILGTEKSEGEGEANVYALVDDLTRKIKSNFNLSASQLSSDQDMEVGIITTPYPEALRYYREGRSLFLRIDYRSSIALMERAIQIDPDFAMAYRSIGSAYSNLGENRYKVKEYFDKAMEKRSRLSYKEKMIIEAQYNHLVTRDRQKSFSLWKELLKDYPEDSFINQAIGVLYSSILDYDNSIRHYQVCRKNRNEFFGTYTDLGFNYMALGEYEKAREVYRDCIDYFGDSALMRRRLADAYVFEGRIDEAIPERKKAIEMSPGTYSMGIFDHLRGDFEGAEKDYGGRLDGGTASTRMNIRRWLAILNMTQGKYEGAASYIEDGLALAESENNHSYMLAFLGLKSWNLLAVGKFEGALEIAQIMWERAVEYENLFRQVNSLFLQSLVHLRIQNPEGIRKAAALVERQLEKFDLANTPRTRDLLIFRGLTDLTEGKFGSAVEILRRAWESQDRVNSWLDDHILYLYYLGEAQVRAGDLEGARKSYEEGLRLIAGKVYYGDLWAKSHLRLGEVYEKLGNQDKAIENTEKFLEMWKDADPGLPEVEEATKRLAELKGA